MEENYPRIKQKPTNFKYYCECEQEIHPAFNYCPNCGKKLDWSDKYIDRVQVSKDDLMVELFGGLYGNGLK